MSERSDSSTQSNLSGFTETTKFAIRARDNNKCWACMSPDVEFAHVMARADRQFPLWVSAGLVDYKLSSAENGISLCPTCHDQYDRYEDPGFLILPSDLQFFVNFEMNDKKRREKEAKPIRQIPSKEDYLKHCIQLGRVPPGSQGGLYDRVMLKHITPQVPWDIYRSPPAKIWGGSPVATLRRAILGILSSRAATIDSKVLSDLTKLRNLYFTPGTYNPINPNIQEPPPSFISPPGPSTLGIAENFLPPSPDPPGPSLGPPPDPPDHNHSKKRAIEDHMPESNKRIKQEKLPEVSDIQETFNLGSDWTANDICRQWAHLCA
ncbi:hypothetical protein N7495_004631 [Penicillium taxi]|uniref:uncharacterized protein n=1 Tax=Penicillium taxi TaxID=168475 RepID=UPI0025451956|nr:uncharacterized protein N7495_004631 [Penicillium taxi]KAJ5899887.1 hypothetical protein N7495_004631 [Penicillium taxi]